MTPKEKAIELYGLYVKEIFQSDLAPTINKTWELNDMWIVAKKCALIAVDEIINSEPQKPLFKTTIDVHGVKEDIHDYPPDLFWQDVKEEIGLL